MQSLKSMSRKQLALEYGISDKTFTRRLKEHNLLFGSARVLLPDQVRQIIDALGPWTIKIDDA